ncbi:PDZ domain-containing protein [Carnobacterium jeotgali]|uniref:PDZ domain-containing protein n=1 Tax=Carnobacterium jeotgali TaxID=545534 RepID=UPI0005516622|nr:PDZ domain-containing protein [Carnobacterium jeotgali]
MAANFFIALALFFVQPVFIIGLVFTIWTSYRRINHERSNHRVAIYNTLYEIKNYLLLGLLFGVVGSILLTIIGVPVTMDWIIIYQIVAIVSLIFGYRFIHPLFTFSISSLLLIGLSFMLNSSDFSFMPSTWYHPLSQAEFNGKPLLMNVFIILIFLLATSIFTIKRTADRHLSARFLKTKRGKKIAKYPIKPFWVLPLLLVVPGESFHAFFSWWPVFSIGNEQYSFFWLPVLMGLQFTVQSQIPKEAVSKIAKDLMILLGIALISVISSFWVPYALVAGFVLLIVGGLITLDRHRKREKQWSVLFGPAENGIKIIGIRPDTPAEKMNLMVGDTIIECNNLTIETETDFYQALSKNSVYCHLKVSGVDGELRLTETAIYADSPHEIGVVILTK